MSTNIKVVESDSVIVSMTRAAVALAEAKTIQQTKKILDVAAAAEIYARRQKLGEEAEDLAASIKVDALRKLGEMLKAAPKAKARFDEGSKKVPSRNEAPSLADLGLTKKESAVAQKLAALSESDFEQVREGHVTVAKAIAAVTAAKPEPKPAAKTAKQIEAEQAAEDAFGESDPLQLVEELQRENEQLQAQIKAAEADDLKAEAMKWRRTYEHSLRQQSEAMERAKESTDREAWTMKQLRRCGKAVGEEDPSKIAAAVEAMARKVKVSA